MTLISESYVNRTDGYRYGDVEPYEPWTQDTGKLFRSLVREYGRCISSVYVDVDGRSQRVGWVFLKRRQYDDCAKTYLAETWVTLHTAKDTVTRTVHYAEL